jgi:hypothetical protein
MVQWGVDMGNMSYCRFENTSSDIADCIEALDDANWDLEEMIKNASSEYEIVGIKRFIELCREVAENFTGVDT